MAQSTNYTKPTANEVLLCNNVGVGEDGRNEILKFFDTRSGLALALALDSSLEMKYSWSINLSQTGYDYQTLGYILEPSTIINQSQQQGQSGGWVHILYETIGYLLSKNQQRS